MPIKASFRRFLSKKRTQIDSLYSRFIAWVKEFNHPAWGIVVALLLGVMSTFSSQERVRAFLLLLIGITTFFAFYHSNWGKNKKNSLAISIGIAIAIFVITSGLSLIYSYWNRPVVTLFFEEFPEIIFPQINTSDFVKDNAAALLSKYTPITGRGLGIAGTTNQLFNIDIENSGRSTIKNFQVHILAYAMSPIHLIACTNDGHKYSDQEWYYDFNELLTHADSGEHYSISLKITPDIAPVAVVLLQLSMTADGMIPKTAFALLEINKKINDPIPRTCPE